MSGQGGPPLPPNGSGSGPPGPSHPSTPHFVLPHPGLPGFTADPFGMAIASMPFEQLAAQLNLQLQAQHLQQQHQQNAQQQAAAQLHAQQQQQQAMYDQAAMLQAAQAAVAQQKQQMEQQQQLQQQQELMQQVQQLQHQQQQAAAAAAASSVATPAQPQLAQANPGGLKKILTPAAVQQLQMVQETHRPRPRASKEEYVGVQCHICGAAADGMHYRAISCRSCNAFFRRAVSYEHEYKCRFGGNCNVSVQVDDYGNVIDETVRCACRACRYRKCVEAGMLKTCVQPSRDPTGSQKEKKKQENMKEGGGGVIRQPRGQCSMTPRELIRDQQIRDGAGTSSRMVHRLSDEEDDVDIISIVSVPSTQYLKTKAAPRSRKQPMDKKGMAAARLEEKRLADVKMEIEDDDVDGAILATVGEGEGRGRGARGRKRCPPIDRPWDQEKVDGYAKFEKLVSCYHEHLRLMQLAMTPIESFLQQFETGIELREMHPNDVPQLSTTELSGLLYWIEKLEPYPELQPEDRRALFKRYSVRKLSLDHFYNASKWTEEVEKGNFVMLNNTFVPPHKTGFELATDDEKQITAKAEIFLPTFEQMWRCVIRPFNRMQITDAEMVFLHSLLLWSPLNNTHVMDGTKTIMHRQREWAVIMLFKHYEVIGQEDPDVRFGELCHLLAEVEVICDKHCQDFQVAKLFEFCDMSQFWYEKWCYSADRIGPKATFIESLRAFVASGMACEIPSEPQSNPNGSDSLTTTLVMDINEMTIESTTTISQQNNVNTMQVPAPVAASPFYTTDGDTAEEMLEKELQKAAAAKQAETSSYSSSFGMKRDPVDPVIGSRGD